MPSFESLRCSGSLSHEISIIFGADSAKLAVGIVAAKVIAAKKVLANLCLKIRLTVLLIGVSCSLEVLKLIVCYYDAISL